MASGTWRPRLSGNPQTLSAEADLKLLHDFSSPSYFDALETSIRNGLGIVLLMLCVGAALISLGGGFNKKESSAQHH